MDKEKRARSFIVQAEEQRGVMKKWSFESRGPRNDGVGNIHTESRRTFGGREEDGFSNPHSFFLCCSVGSDLGTGVGNHPPPPTYPVLSGRKMSQRFHSLPLCLLSTSMQETACI